MLPQFILPFAQQTIPSFAKLIEMASLRERADSMVQRRTPSSSASQPQNSQINTDSVSEIADKLDKLQLLLHTHVNATTPSTLAFAEAQTKALIPHCTCHKSCFLHNNSNPRTPSPSPNRSGQVRFETPSQSKHYKQSRPSDSPRLSRQRSPHSRNQQHPSNSRSSERSNQQYSSNNNGSFQGRNNRRYQQYQPQKGYNAQPTLMTPMLYTPPYPYFNPYFQPFPNHPNHHLPIRPQKTSYLSGGNYRFSQYFSHHPHYTSDQQFSPFTGTRE